MKCKEFNQMIDVVISEENIDDDIMLDFKHHMKNCKSCRETYDGSLKLINTFRNIPFSAIPKGFIKRTIPVLTMAYRKSDMLQYYVPESKFPFVAVLSASFSVFTLFAILIGLFYFSVSDAGLSNISIPEFTLSIDKLINFAYIITFISIVTATIFLIFMGSKLSDTANQIKKLRQLNSK